MNFYSHYKVFVYNHDFEKIDDVLSIIIFEKIDKNRNDVILKHVEIIKF